MTRDVELLVQNLLMEHNGDALSALRTLANRAFEAEGFVDYYRDRCSYGYIRRLPHKRPAPLVLDSIPALDIDRTVSPHG
jgi:hypothetical protein